MIFKPSHTLALSTINAILQSSVGDQMDRTGNISEKMCDYIDRNKYMLSDNRIPFISHEKLLLFNIEYAELSYETWITEVCTKILSTKNIHLPFTILEQKFYKREYENADDDKDLENFKRKRFIESNNLFKDLKENLYLDKTERRNVIKTIKGNLYMEYVEELAKVFSMSQGEFLLQRLSEEQRFCLFSILDYAYPEDLLLKEKTNVSEEYSHIEMNPYYKIFFIEGNAGCGKSAIIESLNFYIFKNHNNYTKLLYITQTNILCQSVNKRCFYNKNMQYMTFFKFLSILNLSFINKKKLLLHCDAMKVDAFQHTCGVGFLNQIGDVINLPNMEEPKNKAHKPRIFIIFDEIYTISSGKLSLFLFLVRSLKLNYPNLTIYCILIGDKLQLRPFTKTENIKLNVCDKKTNADDTTTTTNNDLNLLTLISHNECLSNATHFHLTQQFRIVDHKYQMFVESVRNAENRTDVGIKILESLQKLHPNKINDKLSILYPLEDILLVLQSVTSIKEYRKIAIAMQTSELFTKILDITIFCFTNQHAHYYNIALAFSYWNQIELLKHKLKTYTTTDFVTFALIYNYEYLKLMTHDKHNILELLNDRNYLVNILPLLRYCPYKVLTSSTPVARLSIVYLLDWEIGENNNIMHLTMFSPDINLIFNIIPERFEMNLFKRLFLFGFPLQLAFSSTFASSQGLTLDKKIAISCANISKAELYVCLTRIKKFDDLVRVL